LDEIIVAARRRSSKIAISRAERKVVCPPPRRYPLCIPERSWEAAKITIKKTKTVVGNKRLVARPGKMHAATGRRNEDGSPGAERAIPRSKYVETP
jgi:hypothetical protein